MTREIGRSISFPLQTLSLLFHPQTLAQIELYTAPKDKYPVGVYVLPKKLDEEVARLHLDQLGVKVPSFLAFRVSPEPSRRSAAVLKTFTNRKPLPYS